MESIAMSNHPSSSNVDPRRILVRGVNWLGDAVMITPALHRLREKFPQARITLLTHEKLAELWKHQPSLDDTLSFAAGESVWSVCRRLRGEQFDLALVLPNSPRAALEAWLARIPQRIGYARPWRNWFLTRMVASRFGWTPMRKLSAREVRLRTSEASPITFHVSRFAGQGAHQIHEYLHLVAAVGASAEPLAPSLEVTPAEIADAERAFLAGQLNGLSSKQPPLFFGLNPGAEYGPAKRWPVDRFIEAARQIQQRADCTWLIFGSKADLPTAEAIHSALLGASERNADGRAPRSGVLNLAGKTSLRELMALLKLCRVLLTNDTGPMHVAAALGTPVVVPFGSTSPELTGPGLPGDARHRLLKSAVPCSPCFRRKCPIDFRCMASITVDQVVGAVTAR
jgi:heptosyltransferase-2